MTTVVRTRPAPRPPTIQPTPKPKIQRVSDLMRSGMVYRGQSFGAFYNDGKSCAIGAAIEGKFGHKIFEWNSPTSLFSMFLREHPVIIEECHVMCPQCHAREQVWTWAVYIIHLNDYHNWSRDRIAGDLARHGL